MLLPLRIKKGASLSGCGRPSTERKSMNSGIISTRSKYNYLSMTMMKLALGDQSQGPSPRRYQKRNKEYRCSAVSTSSDGAYQDTASDNHSLEQIDLNTCNGRNNHNFPHHRPYNPSQIHCPIPSLLPHPKFQGSKPLIPQDHCQSSQS